TVDDVVVTALGYLPVNQQPVANNDSYSVSAGATLTVNASGVLANDTDADGDNLTASLAGGVSHGSLSFNANGSFSYTPTSGYLGPDSFTYRASDGITNSAAATVSLSVQSANHAPVANNDSYNMTQDTTLTVTAPGVLSNDT